MVDATWRVQSNSGTQTAVTGPTPTLPNPTQPGSTLLLMTVAGSASFILPGSQSYDPPWSAELPAASGARWWRRDNQPAGETSWPIAGSVSVNWAWRVEEWAGLSTVSQPDATSVISSSPSFVGFAGQQVNDLSTNAPPNYPVPDVADFAGLAMIRVIGGSAVWPAARSWNSPWSELDVQTTGDGSHNTDLMLLVAEAYPGVSGTLDVALTWDISGGGTYADKSVWLGAACYQPAVPSPGAGVLTA